MADASSKSPRTPPGGKPLPLRMGECVTFFLPLIFTGQMMVISNPIINAAMARLPQPTIAIAGFAIAFSLSVTVNAVTGPMAIITISNLTDRRSVRALLRFVTRIGAVKLALLLVIGLTPLGRLIFGTVLGASDEVAAQAQTATIVLAFVSPLGGFRNMAMGALMVFRRTPLITVGTTMRLVVVIGTALTLPLLLDGAVVGAFALFAGILTETVFMSAMAARYVATLPADGGDVPTQAMLWRFGWPLMVNQVTEGSLALTVNFFLGRLNNPDLALASYGVARGLVMLLVSPLRNLDRTAQALVHYREDLAVLTRFVAGTSLVFTGLMVGLFHSPLRGWVLYQVMGLSPALAEACVEGLLIGVAVPAVFAGAALLRGLLSSARQTTAMAYSAAVRYVTVVLVCASTLVLGHLNGAAVGITALALAFALEAAYLATRFFRNGQGPAQFPPLTTDAPAEPPPVPGR